MSLDPGLALQRIAAPTAVRPAPEPLLLIGGAGALGSECLAQALARGPVQVATTAPLRSALRGLRPLPLPTAFGGDAAGDTPLPPLAVIVFDRARGRRGREDAFFQPEPAQLPALARWL
ncbi:MAG TPA: hypothetical protein VJM48_08740, partial [Methylibium sp.]|nr:hypothetical protein [Methylibium sp.]